MIDQKENLQEQEPEREEKKRKDRGLGDFFDEEGVPLTPLKTDSSLLYRPSTEEERPITGETEEAFAKEKAEEVSEAERAERKTKEYEITEAVTGEAMKTGAGEMDLDLGALGGNIGAISVEYPIHDQSKGLINNIKSAKGTEGMTNKNLERNAMREVRVEKGREKEETEEEKKKKEEEKKEKEETPQPRQKKKRKKTPDGLVKKEIKEKLNPVRWVAYAYGVAPGIIYDGYKFITKRGGRGRGRAA